MAKYKKQILVVLIAITLAALLGGAYVFLSQKGLLPGTPGSFPGLSELIKQQPETPEEETNIVFRPGKGMELPRLYELHTLPVAGITFFEDSANKKVFVRYIERGLGHIYQTDRATYEEARVSSVTRPKITEALWGRGGKGLVLRTLDAKNLDQIKTRTVSLDDPSNQKETSFPDFIPFMATSGDGTDALFYLANSADLSLGAVSTFGKTKESVPFRSSFTEWLPQFPNKNLVTLTTRPSANIPGYTFFLNPATKKLDSVLGGINGLTTLTRGDGLYVLYSKTVNGNFPLFVYDAQKKVSRDLSIYTLPEKCVWGLKDPNTAYCAVPKNYQTGNYPDLWYQGVVSFTDELWKLNVITGDATRLLSLNDPTTPKLDIQNMAISSDDAHLAFMNKVTGTPWIFRIALEAPKVLVPEVSQKQAASTPTKTAPPTQAIASSSVPSFTAGTTTPANILDGMKKIK